MKGPLKEILQFIIQNLKRKGKKGNVVFEDSESMMVHLLHSWAKGHYLSKVLEVLEDFGVLYVFEVLKVLEVSEVSEVWKVLEVLKILKLLKL